MENVNTENIGKKFNARHLYDLTLLNEFIY